jgi:hypothetical protein
VCDVFSRCGVGWKQAGEARGALGTQGSYGAGGFRVKAGVKGPDDGMLGRGATVLGGWGWCVSRVRWTLWWKIC